MMWEDFRDAKSPLFFYLYEYSVVDTSSAKLNDLSVNQENNISKGKKSCRHLKSMKIHTEKSLFFQSTLFGSEMSTRICVYKTSE